MLTRLDQTKDSEAIGYFTSEHLRMSGAYWCIGSNILLGNKMEARRPEMIKFIKATQHKCGGFGGNLGHDPHVTTSLYALLILAMFDATNEIDLDLLASYFKNLQNEDGSFKGD